MLHVLATALTFAAGNGVPNPPPAPPPDIGQTANTVLSWLKYGGLIGGVAGLTLCGIMMTVGRRNRHALAADGAAGIPWVLGGLSLVSMSSGIVAVFLHP